MRFLGVTHILNINTGDNGIKKFLLVVGVAVGVVAVWSLVVVIVVFFVIPSWQNYQRFSSLRQFVSQLTLTPVSATLITKTQDSQPPLFNSYVDIEYDYRLSRTVSAVELEAYYNQQLQERGWKAQPVSVGVDASGTGIVGLPYVRRGSHGDTITYSVDAVNGKMAYLNGRPYPVTQEIDISVESVIDGLPD